MAMAMTMKRVLDMGDLNARSPRFPAKKQSRTKALSLSAFSFAALSVLAEAAAAWALATAKATYDEMVAQSPGSPKPWKDLEPTVAEFAAARSKWEILRDVNPVRQHRLGAVHVEHLDPVWRLLRHGMQIHPIGYCTTDQTAVQTRFDGKPTR
jgi:hypothetical protein